MKNIPILLGLLLAGGPHLLQAELWMPSIFGDHMVLQREISLPVWGKADPDERVVVSLAGQKKETIADADGKWRVRFDPLPPSRESVEMRVQAGGETRVFKDVLLGDVWLCSGQSNMGMGINVVEEKAEILASANRPALRLFEVSRSISFFEADDLPGKWVVSTPESVLGNGRNGFSAVGYLFGSELQERLGLPVGLIQSAVGGTRIHAWSRLEMLQSLSGLSDTETKLKKFLQARDSLATRLAQYEAEVLPKWQRNYEAWQAKNRAAMETWKVKSAQARELGQPAPPRPTDDSPPRRPTSPDKIFSEATVLFNGMIRPLIPFGICGVIWYQGESNAYPGMADEYGELSAALISDWRSIWGQGDFPFLFVQLPNLEGDREEWSILRDGQRNVLSLPNTGMAVTIDAGNPKDLHPQFKKPVAQRLVLAARGVAYGEPITYSGPLFRYARSEGSQVRLAFGHTGGGLVIGVAPLISGVPEEREPAASVLQGFELAGADGKYHIAEAKIEGAEVTLRCEAVPEPKRVRYAWGQNPKPFPNLYNREGLPASPFVSEIASSDNNGSPLKP